ncbi:serine hydrolase [Dinghuibacter silviterrae]|uniref:CubicO group peptidase (Beta-lactamase class C family) n=1 Tax=Dinghuibacter silviterrae TaxID=1539049 RepID=A0A4R8DF70_9BACT|nr:serine hydrolase [Dinghuibacter silviterrae]TDW96067.1 CubicO group peptidase (beta-lactamase class C family) [Dinghuibacter silviterrae]
MRFSCLIIAFFMVSSLSAQNGRRGISGRILSSDDRSPLSYASVRLTGSGQGTVSNDSGAFFIWIPAENRTDTLLISHLGFRSQKLPVAALQKGDAIILEKEAVEMREVVVGDPLQIILKAAARIPENYLTQPYVTRGFYRATGRKTKEYGFLSETLFDIYNYAVADWQPSQFHLVKHREFKDSALMSGITMGLSPNGLIGGDIVRHLEGMKVFSSEGPNFYDYRLEGLVALDGRKAYEVSFDEKDGLKESRLKGEVFIDAGSYAFLYFDFGLSPKGIAYLQYPEESGKRFLLKLFGITIKKVAGRQRIRYRPIGNKWVLSDVTMNNEFRLQRHKNASVEDLHDDVHYVVTDVDTTVTHPFSDHETTRGNEMIEDEQTDEDSLFWKDYTVILPDFPEQPVISRIKAANAVFAVRKRLEDRLRKLPKDPALRIDTILAAYHAQGLFNGSALVSWKGKVLIDKGYGFADRSSKRVADGTTGYRIGSTSKTFTSVIINQLVSEWRLRLDTPIRAYIPYYANGNVTIDQLLTHRSGIHNLTEEDDYLGQELTRKYSLKEVVTRFCSDTLDFPPGSQFRYSNSGFVVLALIAEAVTGKPFDTLLEERIFRPLQMDHSYVGMRRTPPEAIGYINGGPEYAYDARNLIGAGGIVTTSEDLLKYSEGLHRLLPPDRLQDMLKPRVDWDEYKAWYDYGWMTDKDGFSVKHIVIYHPGTDLGFFTMFARQDDRNATIVLLNNTGDFPRFEMTDLILSELNR